MRVFKTRWEVRGMDENVLIEKAHEEGDVYADELADRYEDLLGLMEKDSERISRISKTNREEFDKTVAEIDNILADAKRSRKKKEVNLMLEEIKEKVNDLITIKDGLCETLEERC